MELQEVEQSCHLVLLLIWEHQIEICLSPAQKMVKMGRKVNF